MYCVIHIVWNALSVIFVTVLSYPACISALPMHNIGFFLNIRLFIFLTLSAVQYTLYTTYDTHYLLSWVHFILFGLHILSFKIYNVTYIIHRAICIIYHTIYNFTEVHVLYFIPYNGFSANCTLLNLSDAYCRCRCLNVLHLRWTTSLQIIAQAPLRLFHILFLNELNCNYNSRFYSAGCPMRAIHGKQWDVCSFLQIGKTLISWG